MPASLTPLTASLIVDIFEETVAAVPVEPALDNGAVVLTYSELAARLTGTGEGPLALLRLAGVAAASANVMRNSIARKPTLPACATNHPVTLPAYGTTCAQRWAQRTISG